MQHSREFRMFIVLKYSVIKSEENDLAYFSLTSELYAD